MLTVRRRPGLPARRRVGTLYVTMVAVLCMVVGLAVGSESGRDAGVSAGLSVLLLPILTSPVWLVAFHIARTRLRLLRARIDPDGEGIAVRTTAEFSTFPPGERSVIETYPRPWTTYQLLTLTDRGLELRTVPRRGSSAGAHLRFDRIETVRVGSADFGELRERAIIISGSERGRPYRMGLVPIDEHSPTLRPVGDHELRSLADEIVAAVESTTVPGRVASA
jgi:hypothetical protein